MTFYNIEQINEISKNIEIIAVALSKKEAFWNTQWFAGLLGGTAALLITWSKDFVFNRNRDLSRFYDYLIKDGHWCCPESIARKARMTVYCHSQTKNGIVKVIPEKVFAEKIVIELRKRCKYWTFPLSRIRFLFSKYEKKLKKLPNNHSALEETPEYKEAEKTFEEIMEVVYKKTGESMWTAR